MSDAQKPLDPAAAATIARARRLMLTVMAATFIAVAVVFIIIGYRLSRTKESAPSFAEVTDALPAGARVVSTAVGADHVVVTIEINGATEIRTYDPDTLKPLGRLRLQSK